MQRSSVSTSASKQQKIQQLQSSLTPAGDPPIIGVSGDNMLDRMSPCPADSGVVEVKRPVYSQRRPLCKSACCERTSSSTASSYPVGERGRPASVGGDGGGGGCCGGCLAFVERFVPFVRTVRTYQPRQHLPPDLISGLSTGVMRIPQSMAYSLLAYLSPVHGLYTAFIAGMTYCLLGTSPHLVLTCQGVVSLMVGQAAFRYAERSGSNLTTALAGVNHTDTSLELLDQQLIMNAVAVTTLLVGIYQLVFGCLRLGMLTNYLSDPLVGGFTTGAAVEVVIIGLSAVSIGFLALTKLISARLSERRFCQVPVPGELILVVATTVLASAGQLDGLSIGQVGPVPRGFAPLRVPPLTSTVDAGLVQDCAVVAIVGFTVALSVAKKFALQYDTELDANQEFFAYGAGNVLGSFAGCFASTSSMSCSALHESLGGRSQVANLIASGLVLLTILFLGPCFSTTPSCVLSAIILVNLKSMLWQFGDVPQLWRVSKIDFLLWMVTFVSVVCFKVDTGLIIGVAFSLLTIVFRSQWPYACVLGRIPHTDIYKNLAVTPDACEIDGVKIFRYEGSLYFASADHFRDSLYRLTGCNPRQLALKRLAYNRNLRQLRLKRPCLRFTEPAESGGGGGGGVTVDYGALRPSASLHHVILDFSCCSFIDSVGIRMLNRVLADYSEAGVTVYLSNTRAAVRFMLSKPGASQVNPARLYLTNHDAVVAALTEARKLEEMQWLEFDSRQRRLHFEATAFSAASTSAAAAASARRHHVSRLASEVGQEEFQDSSEEDEEESNPELLLLNGSGERVRRLQWQRSRTAN
uniref:STAS domain-containing protein n=1 Tax=Macrostomum lignano TaxID=282301 RepID=A0A1I8GVI0_9PLAT